MEGGRIRKYGQKQQQLSPDRAKVWKERSPKYRQREPEPEVPSGGHVIEKLNGLRGPGMASMYSWSCK
nr:hypothetical protein [Tanacetum cinerariifolium]